MPVDPSSHIPLIYRVAGQMGFQGSDIDEAFSVGLVSITEAARKFDENRNVPVANWLGQNLRWSLQSWRARERRIDNFESPIEDGREDASRGNAPARLPTSLQLDQEHLEAYLTHKELCSAIKALPDRERAVITGDLLGYTGVELAKGLGITTVAVTRAKQRAHALLRAALT